MSEAARFILGVRSQALLLHALAAAASLGVADALEEEPLDVAELARRCKANADGLYRLLRMLAGHGIFAADASGRFRLTAGAGPLRRAAPDSLVPLLAGAFPPLVWSAYAELETAIRTGEVAFDRAHGASFFDYLAAHPEANSSFDRVMQQVAAAENPLIAAGFDFARFPVIADIGGGQGGLLAAILAREPAVRGWLFDQPQVLATPVELAAAGLLGRCELLPGDFFTAVPPGADLYLFKRILHDWDNERALAILRHCREAMERSARILVIDAVMRPGNAPDPNKDLDLNIMVLTGGRERTRDEFDALLAGAGFALEAVRPLPPPSSLSLIEARPV
jgi:hypothetical protein